MMEIRTTGDLKDAEYFEIDEEDRWVSVESILKELNDAYNKTAPISTKVAIARLIVRLNE